MRLFWEGLFEKMNGLKVCNCAAVYLFFVLEAYVYIFLYNCIYYEAATFCLVLPT
jgi:hypothetical protein